MADILAVAAAGAAPPPPPPGSVSHIHAVVHAWGHASRSGVKGCWMFIHTECPEVVPWSILGLCSIGSWVIPVMWWSIPECIPGIMVVMFYKPRGEKKSNFSNNMDEGDRPSHRMIGSCRRFRKAGSEIPFIERPWNPNSNSIKVQLET